MSPPTPVIAWVAVQRMTFKWFVAMTSHYVTGLFESLGIILYKLQRLGLIDVDTRAFTAGHDALIQFSFATKGTGRYQYVLVNMWLMPCAFPSTQNQLLNVGTILLPPTSPQRREHCTPQSLLLVIGFCVPGKAQGVVKVFLITYFLCVPGTVFCCVYIQLYVVLWLSQMYL